MSEPLELAWRQASTQQEQEAWHAAMDIFPEALEIPVWEDSEVSACMKRAHSQEFAAEPRLALRREIQFIDTGD